jgi:TRAP-type mannitol/chloroaromatic compound transport system permease large subunit
MPGEFRVGSTSAGDMFLGALLPGIVLVGLYMLYVFVYARFNPKSAPPVPFKGQFDFKFWIKVIMVIIPPLALIFAVLGSILMGIATVNQAGSIGAIGATIMSGYRLHQGKKDAYYPLLITIAALIPIFILSNNYNLNIKALETRNLTAIFVTGFFTIIFIIGIIWSFWRAYKIDNVLKEVVTETCVTTSMVFIILLGAAMLTSGFRAFGGEELVRDFLQDLPGGFWTQFIVVMVVIFLLGFFLDFIEIAVVVVPIIAPILLAETGANVSAIWLGVMIGVNLQTSFLTPPFGFALFYLKGVAPKIVTTLNIWKGVVPFIALQLIGLGIVGFYPTLVNYLPARTYLTSHVAPPPMNPKLQQCLQEYKFAIYNNEEQKIMAAITGFQQLVPSNLPNDKLDIFEEHFENALGNFALVKKLQKTEKEYNLFAKNYRELHFSVRKKEKKIRKINGRIKKLESEIRNLDKDDLAEKNKIQLKIENYELEIDEVTKQIPENWLSRNKEFKIIQKAKNTQTKRYRKNVDQAYDNLEQIAMFIKDHEKLNELSPEINNIKENINNENYEKSISIIDSLFDRLGEISGTEEFANRLDDLLSLIDSEEIDVNKISEVSSEALILFDKEVKWRKDAAKNLMPELEKYNLVIKDNIGLRLQSRLSKDQAKYVAKCNSIHRDISLNF